MKPLFKPFIILTIVLLAAIHARAAEKIYVYNWTEYLPESVLAQFTKETGIEVVYATYESNEAMYAKLKLIKKDGYDVAVPSTYFVSKMGREGMLIKLDQSLLPNMKHLDPELLNKDYDPNNTYSVPYMWGSTGIAVNTDEIPKDRISSWADLWKPEFKGRLLLQDDLREVFHMALRLKGFSGNTTNPGEIEQAYLLLKDLMPNVLLFNSDSPRLPFLAGEVSIGMMWNGEAWMARQENPAIRYIYPKEGASFWVDSFVIPQGARNPKGAHAFINFMMKPEVAKACVEEYGYPTPVKTAIALLDSKIKNNRTIFPDTKVIQQGQFQNDVGQAIEIYQKYWEKLRTGD
ncbi:MAG: extracellular solute-binding protein [Desulfobacterales bacterium]|nr:extracellular solute-binding protein [Desulfobacterales bacterium]